VGVSLAKLRSKALDSNSGRPFIVLIEVGIEVVIEAWDANYCIIDKKEQLAVSRCSDGLIDQELVGEIRI
jgi:hypothetical protein